MESAQDASINIEIPKPAATTMTSNDDGDTSSIYVRTIKRIIQRTRSTPPTTRLAFTSVRRRKSSHEDIELAEIRDDDYDEHSIVASTTDQQPRGGQQHQPNHNQYETKSLYSASQISMPMYDFVPSINNYDMMSDMSTDNLPFDFVMPSAGDEHRRKPPPFARRYFNRVSDSGIDGYTDAYVQEHQSHHSGADLSESSEPDLNTKWSWKNLKREFKLTHSESLFHLYQAKLQHSFFVALLILNIIFNLGAIISYLLGKFHDMVLCKFFTYSKTPQTLRWTPYLTDIYIYIFITNE